ncbi:hypothetical protein OSB04_016564 [Centaurea solstitialis]|uniref:Integrase catalytic domain-containing protein n=1 Tax=Centaurea solstitialis TaxID=347529 RepID=A0AA38T2U7_9ASTR|nr:hypothetical protein OSB04_016564 [Centaurea solstitialis]
MPTSSEPSNVSRQTETVIGAHSNELGNIQAAYRLNGRNYMIWSQVIRTKRKGKGKIHHILEPAPKKEDPKYGEWDTQDSLIMSWLWDSMHPEVSGTCMFLTSAKEVWETVKQTYSKVKDAALVFEIKTKINSTKQGTTSVTEYYNTLNSLWLELDYYHSIQMKNSEDVASLIKFIEGERIYEFLAGLNMEFDQVQIQVLGKEELPTLNEVFAIIRGEEGRRSVMIEAPTIKQEESAFLAESSKAEGSALASMNIYGNSKSSHQPKQNNREIARTNDLFCNYCKKPGHVKEIYWKLNGRPQLGRNNGGNYHGNDSQQKYGNKKAWNRQGNVAITGEQSNHEPYSFNKFDNAWIVDSGATDHMTNSPSHFSTYTPCSGHHKIRVADGALASIAGAGTISITPPINLKSELATGRMIGHAKKKDGLYYLDTSSGKPTSRPISLVSESLSSNKVQIWLHHFRLGHPSFHTLRTMFPQLFKKINASLFQCESCQYAKHQRVSFQFVNHKTLFPFAIVHTDVWGPSRIASINGARWFVTFIDDCTRVTWLFLMKNKSDVSTIVPHFLSLIQNQFNTTVKVIRSDNGKEYFNQILSPILQSKGIIHQSTCPDTPLQNGVAERKNRHLLETTRALLFERKVPKRYWGKQP